MPSPAVTSTTKPGMALIHGRLRGLLENFLNEVSGPTPEIRSVRAIDGGNGHYHVYVDFDNGPTIGTSFSQWDLKEAYRRITKYDLQNATRSVYSDLAEDRLLKAELGELRDQIEHIRGMAVDKTHGTELVARYQQVFNIVRDNHRLGASLRSIARTGNLPPTKGSPEPKRPHDVGDTDEDLGPIEALRRDVLALLGSEVDKVRYSDDRSQAFAAKAAEQKSLALLKSFLHPDQLRQYEQCQFFLVRGGTSGKLYKIAHGRQMNISELDAQGRRMCGWCFLPQGNLPIGDVLVSQMLALELFEDDALKVANRF